MKHIPRIYCAVIPHHLQRYDTAGDWFGDMFGENFIISKMNADYEFMVLVHEIIEWYLTQKRGIKEEDITKFDIESKHPDPGTLKNAPYHKEHMFAVKIEKQLAKELKINWKKYDKSFEKLKY